MKFYDTHFEDYIQSNNKNSLHPKLDKLYKKFPINIKNFRNLIFYGPKGVGKYTQMLASIKRYSPTELKSSSKINVTYNKNINYFKISDIHFEVDMSLLGCNSKMLWNEVYNQIIDVISAKADTSGIIVCKYFHEIHSELLETFYSYMQNEAHKAIELKFILLTEEISFIPDNICKCCEIITVPRPPRTLYNKCLKNKINKNTKLEEITNMKNIQANVGQLMNPYELVCDKILVLMMNLEILKFLQFRDILYDIFIYNLNITDCIWYILSILIKENRLKKNHLSDILLRTFSFLQYYNNNYRPIYHLESYIFYLISKIHELPECP